MSTRQDRLRAALSEAFAPTQLEVADDSAQHAGHAGAAAGGETHYTIRMVSAHFSGQSRVARWRAVHSLLDTEFRQGLHAVSLLLRAPGEAGASNP